MKKVLLLPLLVRMNCLLLLFLKAADPTPTPSAKPKLIRSNATEEVVAPSKLQIKKVPPPTPTIAPKIKLPGATPLLTAPPKIKLPAPTPVATLPPKIKIPGATPTPTPMILVPPKVKIPKPVATPTPKIIIPAPKTTPTAFPTAPPFLGGTPAPVIDVPAPQQLPVITINVVPFFQAVHPSEPVFVPAGYAPVRDYHVPPQEESAPPSPTGLRAWNGKLNQERRAFDQTRIELAAAADGSRNWQFYWQSTIPNAQAARWEIASMPFYPGSAEFPPPGLIAYVDAETPVKENFFALDFAPFEKAGEPVPKRVFLRVVPVSDQGEPAGEPSNARAD